MKPREEFSAGGILYKEIEGKRLWLIVKSSAHGFWGFPKGHIADTIKNETKEEASLREVAEETGIIGSIIQPAPYTMSYLFQLYGKPIHKTVYYFLMKWESGEIKRQVEEIHKVEFIEEEKLLDTITYENDKKAFIFLTHRFK